MTKVGVIIGRFQVPEPHEGHNILFTRAQEAMDKVIVLVGSSNRARSIKNPWTFAERKKAIQNLYPNFIVLPLNDYMYSDSQWVADVAATVEYVLKDVFTPDIYLFGHHKDGNNYLNWFPQWEYVNVPSEIEVSGTEIRRSLIGYNLLPQVVEQDFAYFEQEQNLFKDYPYKECLQFNCADAIVECSGHILLIQRGGSPGIGNWALPGGFKHNNETFTECAIRELIEETNIRVPKKVLCGSIKHGRIFDSPYRGNGIPRNTYAVHMVVQPDKGGILPRANGGDDATLAKWVPIHSALNTIAMHDDHADIISYMLNTNPMIAISNSDIYNA